MQRFSLCPEGPEVSSIAFGTWRLKDDAAGTHSKRVKEKLDLCLENQITSLDTAEIYGYYEVENLLGTVFREHPSYRDHFEIITKCGIYIPCPKFPDTRISHYNSSAKRIIESVEQSLKHLATDRIDILLVHRPDWFTHPAETATALNELIQQGKILHAGVSNYNVHQFEALQSYMETPLVTNQLEYNLLHMHPHSDGTFDQCMASAIHPMAWSPLAGGKIFQSNNESAQRLSAFAEKTNHALEDLALAWVLNHPSKPQAIIGTNNDLRIKAAAKAAAIEMDRQTWYQLWEAAQGHRIP